MVFYCIELDCLLHWYPDLFDVTRSHIHWRVTLPPDVTQTVEELKSKTLIFIGEL